MKTIEEYQCMISDILRKYVDENNLKRNPIGLVGTTHDAIVGFDVGYNQFKNLVFKMKIRFGNFNQDTFTKTMKYFSEYHREDLINFIFNCLTEAGDGNAFQWDETQNKFVKRNIY